MPGIGLIDLRDLAGGILYREEMHGPRTSLGSEPGAITGAVPMPDSRNVLLYRTGPKRDRQVEVQVRFI